MCSIFSEILGQFFCKLIFKLVCWNFLNNLHFLCGLKFCSCFSNAGKLFIFKQKENKTYGFIVMYKNGLIPQVNKFQKSKAAIKVALYGGWVGTIIRMPISSITNINPDWIKIRISFGESDRFTNSLTGLFFLFASYFFALIFNLNLNGMKYLLHFRMLNCRCHFYALCFCIIEVVCMIEVFVW